jgi:solute carrier family 25 aspartate/glutamate transporter 12/13
MNNTINAIISGYIGAISVYPIDLIKTRVQNRQYSGLRNIIKHEGYQAFYKGSFIQIIGIGPEKALKIITNETILSLLDDTTQNKIIAGGCAGAAQVIITNPIEIVKIQYQMNLKQKKSLLNTIKSIGGFTNLYKGASLCLLRDIPFSAIYFPTFNYLKKYNNGFIAGMIAAIPAAYLVTPFDIIKTRIQTNNINSIFACIKEIYKHEGFQAFWKGGLWRVMKSSPQFGITLFIYENL